MSPIKQKDLTDVEKTESGATRGSTGEVVDALTGLVIARLQKEKEEREKPPSEKAAELLRKHIEGLQGGADGGSGGLK